MDIKYLILFCVSIVVVSVIVTMKNVLKSDDIREATDPILGGLSSIISFFIVITYYERLTSIINSILQKYISATILNNILVKVLILLGIILIIKLLLELVLKLINSFSFYSKLENLKIGKGPLAIFAMAFGIIRGFIVIVLVCIPLLVYNSIVGGGSNLSLLDNLPIYNKLETIVDGKKIEKISSGIWEDVSNNKIYYYNGVTIDEGVKSNTYIDNKARELTKFDKNDREKARSLYTWVGSNIKYDDEKAQKVMGEGNGYESGAIPTFVDRKGICFDYACLYTAMCKAVGLKSRILIGEAFNGEEYISHAWNEVYLEDEDKWVKVDTTFYVAGDYFDSEKFNTEYNFKSIAGEF